MRNSRKSNDTRPGYHGDPIYRNAIHRYLGWLGVACIIACLHAGPVVLLVWLAAAYVLTRDGSGGGRNQAKRNCQSKRRRRC